MSQFLPHRRHAFALIVGALVSVGSLASASPAKAAADPSDVVLVLDFSASILQDVANRDRFASALDRIADRIDATESDLAAGDATVTVLQFATRAADHPGCVELRLFESRANVSKFADCLRAVATAYRRGLTPALSQAIGVDTNYVAAIERATSHLPADAVRPALILFTDGKHDVAGIPVSQVQVALDRNVGDRSPFALLPVGMGLVSTERAALEAGLEKLRIIRDMPACVSGSQFDWPQVVFDSPADAGNAVALALQNVTCTFTLAQTPAPATPTATPSPTPGAVRGLSLSEGDGLIGLQWSAPAIQDEPIEAYRARCRAGEGEWTEASETPAASTTAVISELVNGQVYQCQVSAVDSRGVGAWTTAPMTAIPVGPPGRPVRPAVEAMDHAVRIYSSGEAGIDIDYRYECSPDRGNTWPFKSEAAAAGNTPTEVANLSNGVDYVCRAYAQNRSGLSDPSEPSDVVRPCGSLVECRPVAVPILGAAGVVALGALLMALLGLYRGRTRGYSLAIVDVIHTANLGYGSRLGLKFTRDGQSAGVTGIEPDRSRGAEVRIQVLGSDRFKVVDRGGQRVTASGEPVLVVDSLGGRHSMTLQAFHTATASHEVGER